MPGVGRVGDKDDDGDTKNVGSPDVLVNGKPAIRVGDKETSNNTNTIGSTTVFVNGKPVVRLGDKDSSNDILVGASPDVIAG